MKINIGKLAKLVGRIVLAAPAVIAAVKPVIAPARKRSAGGGTEPDASLSTAPPRSESASPRRDG